MAYDRLLELSFTAGALSTEIVSQTMANVAIAPSNTQEGQLWLSNWPHSGAFYYTLHRAAQNYDNAFWYADNNQADDSVYTSNWRSAQYLVVRFKTVSDSIRSWGTIHVQKSRIEATGTAAPAYPVVAVKPASLGFPLARTDEVEQGTQVQWALSSKDQFDEGGEWRERVPQPPMRGPKTIWCRIINYPSLIVSDLSQRVGSQVFDDVAIVRTNYDEQVRDYSEALLDGKLYLIQSITAVNGYREMELVLATGVS